MDAFKFARLFVSFLVIVISCFVAYIFFKHADGGNASVRSIISSAKREIGINSYSSCVPVFNSCEIKINKEGQICAPDKLIEEINTEIRNPISNQVCIEAIEKMKMQCAKGCALQPDSVISVSGSTLFEVTYIDPKTNAKQTISPGMKVPELPCAAVGKKLVNLKADCG